MRRDSRIGVAFFVSPHGFGHATRAAAVIGALQTIDSSIEVEVVTTAPRRLFDESLGNPISYFEYVSDIGLAQETPLKENLPETLRLLDGFLPFERSKIRRLAERLSARKCDLVVCDIAPLGIAVARALGVPSLLIENFTWDWIYRAYLAEVPGLSPHAHYLAELFESADYHVKAEPACYTGECDLLVNPIGRKARRPVSDIREALEIAPHSRMVLIAMAGTFTDWQPGGALSGHPEVQFVVPTTGDSLETRGNVVRLPSSTAFYHPDLVRAADAVICKLGYSSVAEAYYAGVPLGFIPRPAFRESSVLERFVRDRMHAVAVGADAFVRDEWTSQLSCLLEFPRIHRDGADGARQAAEFIYEIVSRV